MKPVADQIQAASGDGCRYSLLKDSVSYPAPSRWQALQKIDKGLKYIRRRYARVYSRADLVYRPENAGLFYKAEMFNHSAGGMYFETTRPLTPRISVRIKIRGKHYGAVYSGPDVFEAEVVWCHGLPDSGGRRFAVGVAFREMRVG